MGRLFACGAPLECEKWPEKPDVEHVEKEEVQKANNSKSARKIRQNCGHYCDARSRAQKHKTVLARISRGVTDDMPRTAVAGEWVIEGESDSDDYDSDYDYDESRERERGGEEERRRRKEEEDGSNDSDEDEDGPVRW
jgi:hypothetical protein